MSSMAALVMLAAGTVSGPMPDGGVVGQPPVAGTCVSAADPNAIVVCGQQAGPSPRLPMRDDRAAPGEVVRYASDGPSGDPGPPGEPSHLMRTIGTLAKGLRSVLTGEDPGF